MAKKVVALDVDIKTTTVGEAVKKTQSLKSELRQLKQELQTMDESAPQFLEIAKKAGEIEDRIKATNEQVAAFAGPANERALQGIIGVANGIAGGFAAVQGATALFVGENEDLQKVLVKTQAAMSVLNGLTAIQETLKRESAASTLLYTTATKAATIATRIFSVATSFLGKALIATGIGAIVVALGLLIANFDKVVKFVQMAIDKFNSMGSGVKNLISVIFPLIGIIRLVVAGLEELGIIDDAATRKMKKNAEEMEKIRKQSIKTLGKEQKAIEDKYNREIALAKAAGRDTFAIEKQKRAEILKTLFAMNELDRARVFTKEATQDEIKAWNERQKTIKELMLAEEVAVIERQKQTSDKAEEEAQKARDKKIAAERKDQERLIATMQEGYDKELAALQLKHKEQLAEAVKNGENKKLLERLQEQELFDLKVKFSEKIKENDIKTNEAQIKQLDDFFAAQERRKQARQQLEQDFVNSSIDLLGQLGAAAKDQSNLQKGLVLAQIAADTASAISSLVKNSEGNIYNPLTGGLAGAVQFTTGLARIFAGVAQAKRVLQGGGGGAAGGGGGGQQPQLTRSQPPQSFGLDTRAFNQQGDTRVYVVENDITRSQRRVAQLRESAIID
jgi:hypothetical protein